MGISRLFKKEKPRVFLDYIAVTERGVIGNLASTIEGSSGIDQDILDNLAEIYRLPYLDDVPEFKNSDRALQIVVSNYSLGFSGVASVFSYLIPFLWRPKVKITARLYQISSKKTLKQISVYEKMKLHEYLKRAFLSGSFIFFQQAFNEQDMEYLLYTGSKQILKRLVKVT
jgi:hypothetical protein